ncbi:MAG: hypothetical protein ACTSQJ_12320 [Promethearchaeota archaeon]
MTGSELKEFIYDLLTDPQYDLKKVKHTTLRKNLLSVHVIRSRPFEDIISILSDRLKVATISNQHNVILILLNNILFDGKVANYERRIGTRFVDLIYKGSRYELKMKSNVDRGKLAIYINEYYKEMLASIQLKNFWLLGFFIKRIDTKVKKGEICKSYLVVIEISDKVLKELKKEELIKRADEILDEGLEKVREEDDGGIFLPVKNVLIVDRLRDELKEKDKALKEKDRIIKKLKEQLKKATLRDVNKY